MWKIHRRRSLVTDPGRAVIANSLTSSALVSGYRKAAGVDVSLRVGVEGLLERSIDLWLLVFMSGADTMYVLWRWEERALTVMYFFYE